MSSSSSSSSLYMVILLQQSILQRYLRLIDIITLKHTSKLFESIITQSYKANPLFNTVNAIKKLFYDRFGCEEYSEKAAYTIYKTISCDRVLTGSFLLECLYYPMSRILDPNNNNNVKLKEEFYGNNPEFVAEDIDIFHFGTKNDSERSIIRTYSNDNDDDENFNYKLGNSGIHIYFLDNKSPSYSKFIGCRTIGWDSNDPEQANYKDVFSNVVHSTKYEFYLRDNVKKCILDKNVYAENDKENVEILIDNYHQLKLELAENNHKITIQCEPVVMYNFIVPIESILIRHHGEYYDKDDIKTVDMINTSKEIKHKIKDVIKELTDKYQYEKVKININNNDDNKKKKEDDVSKFLFDESDPEHLCDGIIELKNVVINNVAVDRLGDNYSHIDDWIKNEFDLDFCRLVFTGYELKIYKPESVIKKQSSWLITESYMTRIGYIRCDDDLIKNSKVTSNRDYGLSCNQIFQNCIIDKTSSMEYRVGKYKPRGFTILGNNLDKLENIVNRKIEEHRKEKATLLKLNPFDSDSSDDEHTRKKKSKKRKLMMDNVLIK